jgi:hypothetical protein
MVCLCGHVRDCDRYNDMDGQARCHARPRHRYFFFLPCHCAHMDDCYLCLFSCQGASTLVAYKKILIHQYGSSSHYQGGHASYMHAMCWSHTMQAHRLASKHTSKNACMPCVRSRWRKHTEFQQTGVVKHTHLKSDLKINRREISDSEPPLF